MASSVLRAKTAKGEARLQAIMDATFDIIVSEGLGAASQEAIAQRAAVTQSAVRHYFPTKGSLLKAFFLEAIDRIQQAFDTPPADASTDPQAELVRLVNIHLEAILALDRVFFFEALSYWMRDAELSAVRKTWHESVLSQYEALLERVHPKWTASQISSAALQILTLSQGCWLTLDPHEPDGERKNAILSAVSTLIAPTLSR